MDNSNAVWAKRLKQARLIAGLSQKQLGIQAGLDEFVASTRINRYELGVHKADYQMAQKLGATLNVPTSFFYTEDDEFAELALIYHRITTKRRSELLKAARRLESQQGIHQPPYPTKTA